MILKHEYVLIEKLTEETTKSGILLAVETQNKQLKGVIKAIGSDIDDRDLKIGTTVIYDSLNSSPITIEGTDYTICEYSDIICIL